MHELMDAVEKHVGGLVRAARMAREKESGWPWSEVTVTGGRPVFFNQRSHRTESILVHIVRDAVPHLEIVVMLYLPSLVYSILLFRSGVYFFRNFWCISSLYACLSWASCVCFVC